MVILKNDDYLIDSTRSANVSSHGLNVLISRKYAVVNSLISETLGDSHGKSCVRSNVRRYAFVKLANSQKCRKAEKLDIPKNRFVLEPGAKELTKWNFF
ncbi:hypothetical protein L596_001037 [Steinernema carpocapsae]|uniref:Uncharacterized protein n=1 Tax=Steinernema carpocapsae TaxID=34508 RepID=A0A4U8UP35_STECR|nr:hypothetical protein L596_001037 [Steinernema carpocapsae]